LRSEISRCISLSPRRVDYVEVQPSPCERPTSVVNGGRAQATSVSRPSCFFCFRSLRALLLHELAQSGNVARRASFRPGLVALGDLFQMFERMLVCKQLSKIAGDRLE